MRLDYTKQIRYFILQQYVYDCYAAIIATVYHIGHG